MSEGSDTHALFSIAHLPTAVRNRRDQAVFLELIVYIGDDADDEGILFGFHEHRDDPRGRVIGWTGRLPNVEAALLQAWDIFSVRPDAWIGVMEGKVDFKAIDPQHVSRYLDCLHRFHRACWPIVHRACHPNAMERADRWFQAGMRCLVALRWYRAADELDRMLGIRLPEPVRKFLNAFDGSPLPENARALDVDRKALAGIRFHNRRHLVTVNLRQHRRLIALGLQSRVILGDNASGMSLLLDPTGLSLAMRDLTGSDLAEQTLGMSMLDLIPLLPNNLDPHPLDPDV